MTRRFPVRLAIATPGPRADGLVAEAALLLAAERLPAAPGEVCLAVGGLSARDAARRAERMLAGQGFGWWAHVHLAEEADVDVARRPPAAGRPDGTAGHATA